MPSIDKLRHNIRHAVSLSAFSPNLIHRIRYFFLCTVTFRDYSDMTAVLSWINIKIHVYHLLFIFQPHSWFFHVGSHSFPKAASKAPFPIFLALSDMVTQYSLFSRASISPIFSPFSTCTPSWSIPRTMPDICA